MRLKLAIAAVALCCAVEARADVFQKRGAALTGRYKFIFTGASMTESTLDNGVDCLKASATAGVARSEVSARARLVNAWLYVSGSLFDDGVDISPSTEIFPANGLDIDDLTEYDQLLSIALDSADHEVEFKPPGAITPITVSAIRDATAITGFHQFGVGGESDGSVVFFMTPIDVTDAIMNEGNGVLDGIYEVSGLQADVCEGLEVECQSGASPPTCDNTAGSGPHSKGLASFALLLIIEDPVLPMAEVTVFEGLQSVTGGGLPLRLTLTTGQPMSDPAAGALAFYVIEGDLDRPTTVSPLVPCLGDEYVEVDGDANAALDGLCLTDSDNPIGNIFNSTINVQARTEDPPTCGVGKNPHQCCDPATTIVCGATGIDLDRFDISPALEPGRSDIEVRLKTGADRMAISVLTLSVNVFEEELEVDSQIRVVTPVENYIPGYIRLGSQLEYSIAVSNTGNVPATGVRLLMSQPAFTQNMVIENFPGVATNLSQPGGGSNGTGLVRIENFSVNPGQITEIRVTSTVQCAAAGQQLVASAGLSWGSKSGQVLAPDLIGGGPGIGECVGSDPRGPFYIAPDTFRELRGGGGCTAATPSIIVGLLLLGLMFIRRRVVLLLALILTTLTGCPPRRVPDPPEPPPPSRAIESLEDLPGVPCGGPLMVVVENEDRSTFCIDRFEASVDGGALGDAHHGGGDDTIVIINTTTQAIAGVTLAVFPAANLTWYQAKAACFNAGKRLCTRAEWERACRGPFESIYPYGDTINDSNCNGFFNYAPVNPSVTGSLKTCGSAFGVYDMSGNMEEWVEDAVVRVAGQTTPPDDRAHRGGSHLSNLNALACFGDEFHAPPGERGSARGFRCCMN